jgi:hypothetical protein
VPNGFSMITRANGGGAPRRLRRAGGGGLGASSAWPRLRITDANDDGGVAR